MKQTAVEFIENHIKNSKYYFKLMAEINSRGTIVQPNIFEQAIEIEKQQIIDAHGDKKDYLFSQTGIVKITGEQYYNQTFK